MARATQTRNGDKPLDAIALLKQDHRTVEQLFEQFEETEDGEGIPIAQRVCQLLTIHAQIEEEIFYPAVKQTLEDEELVPEALVEHGSLKALIAQVEGVNPEGEMFDAKIKVMCEFVKHHVKEEQNEMFPKAQKTRLDMNELGVQLAERKEQLLVEKGAA